MLNPHDVSEFVRDIQHRRVFHVAGEPGKFTGLIDRRIVEILLESVDIWTSATLGLFKNGIEIDTGTYTRKGENPGDEVLDVSRVNALIGDGAAVLLRDIATLMPALKRLTEAISDALCGMVQVDLCCSQTAEPIEPIRFDAADLLVLQICGRTTWSLYDAVGPHPIRDWRFDEAMAAGHGPAPGPKSQEIALAAGDTLYLPAGFYHQAAGDDGRAGICLRFAVTYMPTLSLIAMLYDWAAGDELFRTAVPQPDERGGAALDEYLMRLAARVKSMFSDPGVHRHIKTIMQAHRNTHDRIDLPRDAQATPSNER